MTKDSIIDCTAFVEVSVDELKTQLKHINENFEHIIKMAELGDIDMPTSAFFLNTCFEYMTDGLVMVRQEIKEEKKNERH